MAIEMIEGRSFNVCLVSLTVHSVCLGEPPYLNESPLRVSGLLSSLLVTLTNEYALGSLFDCHEWKAGNCWPREIIAAVRRFS